MLLLKLLSGGGYNTLLRKTNGAQPHKNETFLQLYHITWQKIAFKTAYISRQKSDQFVWARAAECKYVQVIIGWDSTKPGFCKKNGTWKLENEKFSYCITLLKVVSWNENFPGWISPVQVCTRKCLSEKTLHSCKAAFCSFLQWYDILTA